MSNPNVYERGWDIIFYFLLLMPGFVEEVNQI